jgi:signal transduction histidine kinase
MWGALTASTPGPPVPAATDERLAQFAELAAAAIANAENKARLTASRARVVATADETRRRLQRDLHDGAQQRLVHTLLALGIAKEAAADGRPAAELIDEAIHHADRANSGLRNLVRGILPASLTRAGLRTAVESLVSDMTLPIELHVNHTAAPAQDRDDRILRRCRSTHERHKTRQRHGGDRRDPRRTPRVVDRGAR